MDVPVRIVCLLLLLTGGQAFGQDCNNNGTDDADEVRVSFASGVLSPIGAGNDQTFLTPAPPPASGPVRVAVQAFGDFDADGFEYIDVYLNGTLLGRVLDSGASDCPASADEDTLIVNPRDYNAALNPDATWQLQPSAAVNAFRCETATTIEIEVSYATGDCNRNGIPDSCETDCNNNGIPDECDLDPNDPDFDGFVSEDCAGDGIPDECQSLGDDDGDSIPNICDNCPDDANPDQLDCDEDGIGDVCALLSGSSTDCDANGIPDSCDVSNCDPNDPSCADCDENGIPDSCESDCDSDGTIDACAIAACDPNDLACADCDSNGVPDGCDLDSGDAVDCNGNLIPDRCEADCDENGIPDDCELRDGTAIDCNGNGIPDACELDDGSSADCNNNGIPDSCEIDAGSVQDCDSNGVPDLCDITAGVVGDCDGNEIPDSCEIASGVLGDCNTDGVPDLCEIVLCDPNDPACTDCDLNGIPDTCAVNYELDGGTQSPFGTDVPLVVLLPDPPVATSSVRVRASVKAALGSSTQFVDVLLDGTSVGTLFKTDAVTCPATPNVSTLLIPAETLNEARDPNGIVLEFIAQGTVDPNLCGPSSLAVTVSYDIEDCNTNEIPDSCEIADGAEEDCDADGVPDSCQPDCDDDGVIDACALLNCPPGDTTCADCNTNGIPDGCEDGFEDDCNNNGISDLCDLASGTSVDADGNGVPDECEGDLASFSDLDSDGVYGDAANTVVTHTFAGGTLLGRIDWNGTLTILAPLTFGGEAQVEITHPNGVARTFQLNPLSQTIGGGPTYPESGSIPQGGNLPAAPFGIGLDPGGTWTFRFFETVDDGGVDARWDDFTVRFESELPTPPTAPTATDLGTLSGNGTMSVNVAAGEVAWFRFALAEPISRNGGLFLELDTLGTNLGSSDDTELALYDRWGYLLASNDDADGTLQSRLSHGVGNLPGTGSDGDLFPGTYYVAVSGFDQQAGGDFAVSTDASAGGTLQLNYTTDSSGVSNLPGDTNGDCVVDLSDLSALLANFGEPGLGLAAGDVNNDGVTDLSDLALVLGQFGEGC